MDEFSQRIAGNWKVTFHYTPTRGQIAKVVVEPWRADGRMPTTGITAKVLKQIKIGSARRYAAYRGRRTDTRKARRARTQPDPPLEVCLTESLTVTDTVARRRKGTRGRPSEMNTSRYLQLLREHDALVVKGDPTPPKTLALAWKVERSTMRTWLAKARTL